MEVPLGKLLFVGDITKLFCFLGNQQVLCRNGFGGGRGKNLFGKSQNIFGGKTIWRDHYFLGVHLVVGMKKF